MEEPFLHIAPILLLRPIHLYAGNKIITNLGKS